MEVPSIAHFVYIPLAVALGFYVGWSVGSKHVRNEWDRAEKRRRLREEEEGA